MTNKNDVLGKAKASKATVLLAKGAPIAIAALVAFGAGRITAHHDHHNDDDSHVETDTDDVTVLGQSDTPKDGYDPDDSVDDTDDADDTSAVDDTDATEAIEQQSLDQNKESEQLLASISDLLNDIKHVPSNTQSQELKDNKMISQHTTALSPELETAHGVTTSKANNAVPKPVETAKPTQPASGEFTHIVKSGENITSILKQYNINNFAATVVELLQDREARSELSSISPKQKIVLDINNHNLDALIIHDKDSKPFIIKRDKAGNLHVVTHKNAKRVANGRYTATSVIITSSLYESAQKAGLDHNETKGVIRALSKIIDFSKDVRKGDKLKVLTSKDGKVLAVSFHGKLGTFKAYRYAPGRYYIDNNKATSPGLLRVPVASYRRISSHFSRDRINPVTHRHCPHNGTDFAAPTGTPVFAGISGTVVISRYKRLNGNYIVIKNGKYMTLYLHLSQRKVKVGDKVTIGDEIGEVGTTGRSTGPHLHYEFRINGKPQDVLKIKIPSSLKGREKPSEAMQAIIDQYKQYI